MKLLVEYIDYHPDNYQGGSGKSFEFKRVIEVDDEMKASEILPHVRSRLSEIAIEDRPYSPRSENYRPAIQRIEVLV